MERLKKILCDLHPETVVSERDRLIDDAILDSLDIVTLVTDINEKFGISIDAEDVIKENFDTLNSIADLIRRRGGKIVCS